MTERRWKYSKAIRLWRFLRWTMTRKPRVYFAYAACPKAEEWGVGNYPRIFWPRRGFRGSGDYTTWHFHRPIYINWQGGKTGAGPHIAIEMQIKWADSWVGAFHRWGGCGSYTASILHLWVCLLPFLPIAVDIWEPEIPKVWDANKRQWRRQA